MTWLVALASEIMQPVHVQTEGIAATESLGESTPDLLANFLWPNPEEFLEGQHVLPQNILSFTSICLIWQLFGPKINIKIFDPIVIEALYIYQFSHNHQIVWGTRVGLWPHVPTQ